MHYSDEIFNSFFDKYYKNKNEFLSSNETREIYNNMNSQIIANQVAVDVLFFGDSITQRWHTDLYFKDFGTIVNRGVGGNTTYDMKQRFESDVLELKPKICIILGGYNNCAKLYQKYSKSQTISDEEVSLFVDDLRKDLVYFAKELKAMECKVFLASICPIGVKDFRTKLIIKSNEMINEVCKEYDCVYVDYYSVLKQNNDDLLQDVTFGDDLHPNVKGYNLMANVLKQLLLDSRRK